MRLSLTHILLVLVIILLAAVAVQLWLLDRTLGSGLSDVEYSVRALGDNAAAPCGKSRADACHVKIVD